MSWPVQRHLSHVDTGWVLDESLQNRRINEGSEKPSALTERYNPLGVGGGGVMLITESFKHLGNCVCWTISGLTKILPLFAY